MEGWWSLRFVVALALSGATAWAALSATAVENREAAQRRASQGTAEPRAPSSSGSAAGGPTVAPLADAAVSQGTGQPSSATLESNATGQSESVLGPSDSVASDEGDAAECHGSGAAPSSNGLPPDLLQTDPALGLPGGGLSYCGPVAVSNGLMWLQTQGFDALAPRGDDAFARQNALVRAIAGRRYMGTSPFDGTSPPGVLRGVSRWVKDAGYRIERLEYQGWRSNPADAATKAKHPQMDWIAGALRDGGVAWLHVGWYHAKRYYPGLHRRGGHWLTVVTAEFAGGSLAAERGGRPPDGAPGRGPGAQEPVRWILRVRDSAPYAGNEPTLERVTFSEIQKGWLFEGKMGLPAKGFFKVDSGLSLKRPDDIPVVDGAVVLVLERQGAQR